MELTLLLAKIVGPVLVLRAVSILIDRQHFAELLDQVEEESKTISFSMFPVAMLMSAIAVVNVHHDTSSLAAIIFHIIAWGMIVAIALHPVFHKLAKVLGGRQKPAAT